MRTSQSKKAGIIFPISRIQKKLRNHPQQVKRISKVNIKYWDHLVIRVFFGFIFLLCFIIFSKSSGCYLAAVIEYLTGNLFDSYIFQLF